MKKAIDWIKKAKPADWLNLVKKLLPHAAIVLSGMLIVFFVIDRVNKPMGFMTNEFHKRVAFALAILSIYFAIQLIALQRRAQRAEYKRRLREAQRQQAAGRTAPRQNPSDGRRNAAPQENKRRSL